MLFKKIKNSFSLKVFIISLVFQILLCTIVCLMFFNLAPRTSEYINSSEYDVYFYMLCQDLSTVRKNDSAALLNDFILKSNACLTLYEYDEKTGKVTDEIVPLPGGMVANSQYEITRYYDRISKTDTITTYGIGEVVRFQDDDTTYFLMCRLPVQDVNTFVDPFTKALPLIAVTVIVLSLLFSFLSYWLFARPIKKMRNITMSMTGGSTDQMNNSERTDEIGQIASGLDKMATDLMKANNELQKKNEELAQELKHVEEVEEEKTVFFMAASHELKTPVTVMEGQLMGMIGGVKPFDNTDEYLPKILRNTKRMKSLIEEIFMVSKIGSDSSIEDTEVDISRLLEKVFDNDRDLFSIRDITIEKDIEPDLAIKGNEAFLSTALEAFISNAVFYSEEGSVVSLTAGKDESDISITIRNNGFISDEDLKHLFDAFYRSDKSRNRSTGGSGLGLFLAEKIIRKHNGSCSITSSDGYVTARISLPST